MQFGTSGRALKLAATSALILVVASPILIAQQTVEGMIKARSGSTIIL
jgi:hypothetical protein